MIAVNARFLTQAVTGTQRYAYEVVRRIPGLTLYTPMRPRSDYSDLGGNDVQVLPSTLRSHVWEQCRLPGALSRRSVLWSPAGLGPLLHSGNVLTVTDISLIDHPEWYRPAYAAWYRLMLPLACRRARRVIAISEFTKHTICSQLGVAPEKVFVTPLGIDSKFQKLDGLQVGDILSGMNIPQRFVLAVGAISPRKNFRRLMDAWSIVRPEFPDVKLVVVGMTQISSSSTHSLGPSDDGVIHLERISDRQLVALYSAAQVYVYPSLYEGFGLPILEAMACGAPVITSNCTAMPEVAGDAALLVNPLRTEELADGLRLLLKDADMRERLGQRGIARARGFSWAKTAELTQQLLAAVSKEIR